MFETLRDFLAHPFDPDNDGQTSALEWFAFVGLLLICIRIWSVILSYILEEN